ncbi:MAG: T9SS type A sorting domain-containing protein [Bacteroidales bacterium]|nr:T9SS type A sorting domain-containing protein [Bacteroidales bacterium]
MYRIIFLCLYVLCVGLAMAQGSKIAFTYDADGNMESRKVVPLTNARSAAPEEELQSESSQLGEQTITIYPNPTKGRIALEVYPLDTEVKNSYSLMDLSGKLLEQGNIENQITDIHIEGGTGIYLLDVHLGKEVSRWKIIKQ